MTTINVFLKRNTSTQKLEFYSNAAGTTARSTRVEVPSGNTTIMFRKVTGENWNFSGITFKYSGTQEGPGTSTSATYSTYSSDFTQSYPSKPTSQAKCRCYKLNTAGNGWVNDDDHNDFSLSSAWSSAMASMTVNDSDADTSAAFEYYIYFNDGLDRVCDPQVYNRGD